MTTPCQDSTTHPYAVWEQLPSGQVLRTFPDEELAAQWCVNNGGKVVANPTNW